MENNNFRINNNFEKSKKSPLKVVFFVLLVVLIAAASAFGVYYWRDNEAKNYEKQKTDEINKLVTEKKLLEDEITKLKDTPVAIKGGECIEKSPKSSVLADIKASITSGNTQALEGYMAEEVNTILAASEAFGKTTPAKSVSYVTDFIGNPTQTTWNFVLNTTILDSYKAGDYKDYFTDISVVGKSNSGKVISFSFDCDAKIDTVFISNQESILK